MEHDSMEEYLELSEKILKNTNKFKDTITTAQKRKDCERKALGIVQLFLEKSISPDVFLKSLVYLNPSYYEDIAEERALLQLCGYPLCKRKISKHKNRYSICSKSKKVYDLNEYGNFCSIFCFNANSHIKSQILDSPLWLRDLEDSPTFNVLVKKDGYAAGINIKSKKVEKKDDFTPISSFAELSLNDVGSIDFSVPAVNDKQVGPSRKICNESKLSTVMENDNEENNSNEMEENKCIKHVQSEKQTKNKYESNKLIEPKDVKESNGHISHKTDENHIQNLNNNRAKIEKKPTSRNNSKNDPPLKDLKIITAKIKSRNQKPLISMINPLPLKTNTSEILKLQENKHEKQSESMKNKSLIELKFSFKESPDVIENSIEKIFRSWVSLETLMFIHGEETIKKQLDVNKLSEHFEKLKISQLEMDRKHKYLKICKRLCEEEMTEEKINDFLVENNFQPLPDYKQMKQESKEFNIKVRTFFSGELDETDDKNFGPIQEKQTVEEETTFNPLDDVNSRKTLRQQILLRTLKNSVESFLDYLEYDTTSVLTELTELIKTFELNSENIVFKLIVRNYLGLICLQIISLRDTKLREALEKNKYLELENSVFEQLPGKTKLLTDCLHLVNDVDSFIENYVKSTDA